jgi:17beta-estradiol 17-dehydrogenase / very-long-chain 3-oxoacyl-CoA reductase
MRLMIAFVLILLSVQFVLMCIDGIMGIYDYLLSPSVNLPERYGSGAWVVITGGSSGQGKCFADEMASRGFNLFLIGSVRSLQVAKAIRQASGVSVRVLVKDFRNAFEKGFFNDIEGQLGLLPPGKIAFLINNVGHRVGFNPYHRMPMSKIRDSLSVGTIVQAMMFRLVIPYMLGRPLRSCIITISAQTNHPVWGMAVGEPPDLYLPFLGAYEASNTFGYTHSNSVHREYELKRYNTIDFVNITPGAVLTSNSEPVLSGTAFAVRDVEFVRGILRRVGASCGAMNGHILHALSLWLIGGFPPMKDVILRSTGLRLSKGLMSGL